MSRDRDDRLDTVESGLARWSRRKLQAKETVPSDPSDKRDVKPETTSSVLTDADMPPLDSLGETSDFGRFLSPGVSDELQRLALRKLFHLPGFCSRDGLDDYDEDFTTMTRLADAVTARVDQHIRHRDTASGSDEDLEVNEDQPGKTIGEKGEAAPEFELSQAEPDAQTGSMVQESAGEDEQET
jgi:hypothetical protein